MVPAGRPVKNVSCKAVDSDGDSIIRSRMNDGY